MPVVPGFGVLIMGAVGILILGSIIVACILLLVQRLRKMGHLRSLNNTDAYGSPYKRRINRSEPMEEQQSLLENGHAIPRAQRHRNQSKSGRWWLPNSSKRRLRKQNEEKKEELLLLKHRGRPSTDLKVLDRDSGIFDAGILAATFCRSSRVLRWHDRKAPFGFDRRIGKHSFLVSPVPNGRRLGDHVQGAVGRLKERPNSNDATSTPPALLLTLLQLPQSRTVQSIAHDSKPFHALSEVAMSIRHPYLMKIIGFHPVSSFGRRAVSTKVVALVRGITNVGSLRDLIYPTLKETGPASNAVGVPLSKYQLQKFSRQIIEGMIALQRMSLTPIHIHSGNCMVVYDDRLEEEIIQLTGFEYSLLGLDMSNTMLARRVKKAYNDGWSNVETLIFGHLFFEMSFGLALDDVVPDYTGTHPTRRFYDHPIRRVLDLIFEGGGFLYTNQEETENEPDNMERTESTESTESRATMDGQTKQEKESVQIETLNEKVSNSSNALHTIDKQSAGEGSSSPGTKTKKTITTTTVTTTTTTTTKRPNGEPTWETRKSKRRLDLKDLCQQVIFQYQEEEEEEEEKEQNNMESGGNRSILVCNKAPTIKHSKHKTWEENEACHDKVLKLARLYHRRKWSKYVRRKKRMSEEEKNQLQEEEHKLLEWSKMEPAREPTDRRRKSTVGASRRPSTALTAALVGGGGESGGGSGGGEGSGSDKDNKASNAQPSESAPADSVDSAAASAASAATNPALARYQQMVKAGVPLMAVQGKMRQDGMGEKEVATVCGVTESGTTSTAQTVKRVERVERVSDSKTSNQGARPQLASVPKITEERGSLLASIRAGGIATLKKSPTPKSSEKKSAAPVNPMMAAILARRKRQ